MEKTAHEVAANRFLCGGKPGDIADSELAAACDAAIQQISRSSLSRALKLAQKFVARARLSGGVLETTAYRTQARACHMSGKHREALAAYLQVRTRLKSDAIARSRIDRALIDVYMYLGEYQKSRLHAQAAIRTFSRLKLVSDLAQTRVNFANVLHRQDRHREAEKLYRAAAGYFEKANNRVAFARTIYNRANTLVQLFEMGEAEKLYRTALKIWQEEGFDLDANDTRYGLAWLQMLTGKFHVALLELAECEKQYRDGGDPRGAALCNLDRAEVYLSLGLYTDALESARAGQVQFEKLGLRYEASKAALFRGQAAAAMERRGEAQAALSRALGGFSEDHNHGFTGACHLLAGDLAVHQPAARSAHLKTARTQFSKAQLPLWEAMCDLQSARSLENRPALQRLDRNAAVKNVPQLFAAWQTLRGDWEFARGDVALARRYWRRAADRLDAVRAELPPVELRSAFSRKQNSPHQRLIAAELDHNPAMAAVWSERYKTAGMWTPLAAGITNHQSRRKVSASLEELARQVSVLARRISSSVGERGLASAANSRRLSYLQNRVREQLIELERNTSQTLTNNDRLLDEMKVAAYRQPLVQFHLRQDDIIAFVHHRSEISVGKIPGGRRRLGEAMQRWRFILEGELLAGHLNDSRELSLEQKHWTDLGEWLWKPLGIDPQARSVLLIPEGELANLPWRALIVDGQPLIERHNIILTPSFRHFQAALRVRATGKTARIFRGAAEDLPEIDRELDSLLAALGANTHVHSPAMRSDWPEAESAKLWHYAGHANLRADNPFYSYLVLSDGALFATDFRLRQCQVNLVTLAACRSGEQVALPGEESTGLVRSLLEMGARNIIAGHWPVSDATTAKWMTAFYGRYLGGESLLESIKHAALTVRSLHPSAYHWAAFSVFGAGD